MNKEPDMIHLTPQEMHLIYFALFELQDRAIREQSSTEPVDGLLEKLGCRL